MHITVATAVVKKMLYKLNFLNIDQTISKLDWPPVFLLFDDLNKAIEDNDLKSEISKWSKKAI